VTLPVVTVVAAIIERDGRLLVTRRPPGVHLEGLWEFPGGKVHDGEAHSDALAREILEELGSRVTVGAEVFSTAHRYEDRRIVLCFHRCVLQGEPSPRLGQDILWIAPSDLRTLTFPPADAELVDRLINGRIA
jgi:8-oxo-dGTP diphosphatase